MKISNIMKIKQQDGSFEDVKISYIEPNYCTAEGRSTTASGEASHAEGCGTTASGYYSHAEGYQTIASGEGSHSEGGHFTYFGGRYAPNYNVAARTAEEIENGLTTGGTPTTYEIHGASIAGGTGSHAQGIGTAALADASFTAGLGTASVGNYETVIGKWNIYPDGTNDFWDKYAFVIGNGTANGRRSNAFTVDWNGKGSFASTVGTNGADYAEYFEWEDKNPLNEDRIGYLVSLNKNKIQKAQYNDNILGIISGIAGVLGDNYEWEWHHKYLTDNFGRIIYEEKEDIVESLKINQDGERSIEQISLGLKLMPKLNPEYDSNKQYISRANRPEWDVVGLMGKLYLRDDGTCIPGEYAKVGTEPGIATHSEEKTKLYVMERINDNVIRVFLK